jgi:nucleotide-binding universal stress UspA family protein
MAEAFDPAARAPVLAAYDANRRDRAPLRVAAALAAVTGAPLYVVGVYADTGVLTPLAAGQLAEDLPHDPGPALDEAVADVDAGGVPSEALTVGAASAARGLDLVARETGAGLLVVGSAADAPQGQTAAGSTGRRLLDGAPCAVALAPRGWDRTAPPATVVAGWVDSEEGRAAVRGAEALAGRAGATLRLLVAVRARPWMAQPAEGSVEDDLRLRAAAAAEPSIAALLGVRVDIDVDLADPADALVAASGAADLVVIGSRGHGPTGATLLGGAGHRLVMEAACPVLVTAREPAVELTALVGG